MAGSREGQEMTPAVFTPNSQYSNTLTPAADEPSRSDSTTNMGECTEQQGHFEFNEIQTELMTHPLSFRIYLHACYSPEGDIRYPVLYLLHGQGFNDDQWDRLGADVTLDDLVAAGEVLPFIIVMPKESNYMNSHLDSKFGPALAQELVPWVDTHYNTCAERECRAIGGISRGAAWAMRVGLIYWEVFGAIGAHSFPPFRGDFNSVPSWLREMPDNEYPHVWIDIGDMDVDLDAAHHFEMRLIEYSVPHEWHIYSGAHNEYYWAAHVEDYLRWYGLEWFSKKD
ncbi:MAG TPA: esterase family protein [Anaerolineae bacterium]|nr:esterase family protein [Anaerolineae bacterium]